MAKAKENKNNAVKYKATPRFFEWIPETSPDFASIYPLLKKGDACHVKVAANRMKWCLDNELLILS